MRKQDDGYKLFEGLFSMYINKLKNVHVAVAVVLLAVLAVVFQRYYGPAEPLSQAEVEEHMANVRNMFVKVGVPDANGGVALEQILAEFRYLAEHDDGKPIYMLNMMKWRDKALFRPDIEGVQDMTAEQADIAYNEGLFYELAKNASHTAYLAKAYPNAISYGVKVDGDANHWGEIGIFRYSSRRDFFNMVGSDSYLNIVYFKLASMGHIAITPTQPHGLLLNPMPNLPVLLSFIFVIAYMLYLLLVLRRKLELLSADNQ